MSQKKRTNYESKGFVRRLAGSIFASRNVGSVLGGGGGDDHHGGLHPAGMTMMMPPSSSGGINGGTIEGNNKWRPRKKMFERLDPDDDEDGDSFHAEGNKRMMTIKSVVSTESDAGEYKRAILYERKEAALKQQAIASHPSYRSNSSFMKSGSKRDVSNYNIKPPTKDTLPIRVNNSITAKPPTKDTQPLRANNSTATQKKKPKHRSGEGSHSQVQVKEDLFGPARSTMTHPSTDLFGFQSNAQGMNRDGSNDVRTGDDCFLSESYHRRLQHHHHDDESSSRQTASSKQTSSTKHTYPSVHHPSFNTVSSDPSDFFSKDAVNALTQGNLARMAAMSAQDGNNISEQAHDRFLGERQDHSQRSWNFPSKFYQFAIDEDKESTVVESNVLPLSFADDDEGPLFGEAAMRNYDDDEEGSNQDESEYSAASLASKGTRIQKRSPAPPPSIEKPNISHKEVPEVDLIFESGFEQTKQKVNVQRPDKKEAKNACFENDDDTFAGLIQCKKNHDSDANDFFAFPESTSHHDSFFPAPQSRIQGPTPPPERAAKYGRHHSAQSLSYSPSPVHADRKIPATKKSPPPPPSGRHARDGRLPLSPLSNVKLAGTKNINAPLIPARGHSTRTGNNDGFPTSVGAMTGGSRERKPDPDESWFDLSHQLNAPEGNKSKIAKRMQQGAIKKPDPYSKSNVFPASSSTQSTLVANINNSTKSNKPRRDPSISDPFDHAGFDDPEAASDPFPPHRRHSPDRFASPVEDSWGYDGNVAPETIIPDEGSAKENIGVVTQSEPSHGEFYVPSRTGAPMQPHVRGHPNDKRAKVQHVNDECVDMGGDVSSEKGNNKNNQDDEDADDDDDDSFDSVALWERSGNLMGSRAAPIGIQDFPKDARLMSSTRSVGAESGCSSHSESRNSLCSHGLPRSVCSRVDDHGRAGERNDDDCDIDDDEDDNKSMGKISACESYRKPLALPSNAILASMLFRTHYDVDQTAVEKKIKDKEEEQVRHQRSRVGGIPDSVLAADQDYMTTISSFSDGTHQEAWRKPSRDLLDYFSKARTLDVASKAYLQSQKQSSSIGIHSARSARTLDVASKAYLQSQKQSSSSVGIHSARNASVYEA
jgi:hypothetical protein